MALHVRRQFNPEVFAYCVYTWHFIFVNYVVVFRSNCPCLWHETLLSAFLLRPYCTNSLSLFRSPSGHPPFSHSFRSVPFCSVLFCSVSSLLSSSFSFPFPSSPSSSHLLFSLPFPSFLFLTLPFPSLPFLLLSLLSFPFSSFPSLSPSLPPRPSLSLSLFKHLFLSRFWFGEDRGKNWWSSWAGMTQGPSRMQGSYILLCPSFLLGLNAEIHASVTREAPLKCPMKLQLPWHSAVTFIGLPLIPGGSKLLIFYCNISPTFNKAIIYPAFSMCIIKSTCFLLFFCTILDRAVHNVISLYYIWYWHVSNITFITVTFSVISGSDRDFPFSLKLKGNFCTFSPFLHYSFSYYMSVSFHILFASLPLVTPFSILLF